MDTWKNQLFPPPGGRVKGGGELRMGAESLGLAKALREKPRS